MFSFLFDLPAYQAHRTPQRAAGGLWRQGIMEEISSDSLASMVQMIAMKLIQQGVKKGDRVILFTDKYSLHWLAADMAIMAAGAISTPLNYPIRMTDLEAILQRIEPVIIIQTSNVELPVLPKPPIRLSLQDLTSLDYILKVEDLKKLDEIRTALLPDDIATIVHTSGSSGEQPMRPS